MRVPKRGRLACLVLAAALLPLTGCTGDDPEPPSRQGEPVSTGVTGIALVDEGCPVLESSQPCPEVPFRARIEAYSQDGRRLGVTSSDEEGAFRLSLEPGAYELRGTAIDGKPVPVLMPVPVTVTAGRPTRVTLHFDSGVRSP